jgi:hypothetical protein
MNDPNDSTMGITEPSSDGYIGVTRLSDPGELDVVDGSPPCKGFWREGKMTAMPPEGVRASGNEGWTSP